MLLKLVVLSWWCCSHYSVNTVNRVLKNLFQNKFPQRQSDRCINSFLVFHQVSRYSCLYLLFIGLYDLSLHFFLVKKVKITSRMVCWTSKNCATWAQVPNCLSYIISRVWLWSSLTTDERWMTEKWSMSFWKSGFNAPQSSGDPIAAGNYKIGRWLVKTGSNIEDSEAAGE